jgi:hypothetical protein
MKMSEAQRIQSSMDWQFMLTISDAEGSLLGKAIIERTIQVAAEHIAATYLEQHQQEVLAAIDATAVANLAVAAAGGSIRDMLGEKLPDVVQHHHHTEREVFQRGIFGGLKRL